MLVNSSAVIDPGDVVHSGTAGDWQIFVLRGGSASHARAQADLAERGVQLSFGSLHPTQQLSEYSTSLFFALLNAENSCVGGFAVQLRAAPVPGHQIMRAEQFGESIPEAAASAVLDFFRDWIGKQKRILRVSIDLFSFDAARRRHLADLLGQRHFHRATHVNGYVETLVLDLTPTEAELFAQLHHSARRKIRQLDKHPVELRTIDDPIFGERMNQLLLETFTRTGGNIEARNWEERIRLSAAYPGQSRIVGLLRSDVEGADSLLAYAWGCRSGDAVFYSEAASTRDTGEQKIALAYGVMWDLIRWAKRAGAQLFDFGGVTRGSHGEDDSLGGISDFKRYFSQQIMEVREEWILDDHTMRARIAGALHRRLRGA
jgi:hypothetical protein